MSTMMASPRFALGRVVATPGALEALQQAGQSAHALLQRHVSGDWGKAAFDLREDAVKLAVELAAMMFTRMAECERIQVRQGGGRGAP